MPSPLAHVGLALVLTAACRPRVAFVDRANWRLRGGVFAVVSVAAIAPDFDVFLAAALPGGMAWHHGPTHSVLGAAVLGYGLAKFGRLKRLDAALSVAAAVTHVALDWSTGAPGAPVAFGVPIFWPASDQRFMDAKPWFGAFGIHRPGFLAHMFTRDAWPIYGRELLTVLGATLLVWPLRAWHLRTRNRAP